jgi:solute:Na+ symporter, SSS family
MTTLDWLIIVAYLGLIVFVGVWASKRASASMDGFFVAGRGLPWWIAGTSMLATSFSSDTPLHTTRMIRENGLGGAWFYWGSIFGGALIAFFFARLWRRTEVMTDAQLFELRYSGNGAATLRGAFALFRGLILEMITLSWVTLGMVKIVRSILDLPDTIDLAGFAVSADGFVVFILVVATLGYTVTSGLWGVVITDLVEFGLAMFGAIILAIVAFTKAGGAEGLRQGLEKTGHGTSLDFIPSEASALPAIALVVYFGVQWWATPYIDGSGQRAQRFLACKDEGQALLAGVWNMAVQWIIRSWPWYITALASLVLYPSMTDHESVYPKMVADLLPQGLRGLMVASFLAAFMSTFDGLLNLTAAYLSNDVYRRFMKRKASETHYVRASRLITLGIAATAGTLALIIPSVLGAFRFKMELTAGLGLVAILRWFWWRINAKTELATLAVSVITAVSLSGYEGFGPDGATASAIRLLLVVAISGLATIVTAFLTAPEPEEKLIAFYERVRPPRLLWGPIADKARHTEEDGLPKGTIVHALICLVFVFATMLGIGKVILGDAVVGLLLLAIGGLSFYVLWRRILGHVPKVPAIAEAPRDA